MVLEGVCLEDVAPEAVFGRGARVYLKRLTVLGPDLCLWQGFDEGGRVPSREVHRSVHLYPMRERPHER